MIPQLLILMLALLAAPRSGPPTEVYSHPGADMEFTAAPGWQELARPGDPGTSEWLDPRTGIHVLMWRTSTEQDAARYLRKMSGMMDLDPDAAPYARRFGAHVGWALDVPGRVDGQETRTLLAVVRSGRSALRPKEYLLHVFQLHCAASDSARLRPVLHELFDSLRVTERVIHEGRHYRLYPETLESPYDVPSPWRVGERDLLAVRTRTGRYALVDCTVENGTANDHANKGRQHSIFDDDVRGYWRIRVWREPTFGERRYLEERFGRYGPEAVAALFGLREISRIEEALGNRVLVFE